MPPPDSGLILTADQKQLLRRWIDEGATYQRHWSFEPIDRPQSPNVANANSPIDGFVNDAFGKVGLQPNPPAKPLTELRRVTLDLTVHPGLSWVSRGWWIFGGMAVVSE